MIFRNNEIEFDRNNDPNIMVDVSSFFQRMYLKSNIRNKISNMRIISFDEGLYRYMASFLNSSAFLHGQAFYCVLFSNFVFSGLN